MIKAIVKKYLNSWWLPTAIALPFIVPLLAGFAKFEPYLTIVILTLMGVLSASIFNLSRRNWRIGLANLLLFAACSIVSFAAIMLNAFFGPSEDGFADNLVMPTNIEIAIPEKVSYQISNQANDPFQMAILAALNSDDHDQTPINTEITSLKNAYAKNATRFKNYLATSKSWRVYRERGNIFATRRWIIGPNWHYSLHGYYTHHRIQTAPQFQTRFTLGLSGKSWASTDSNTTILQAGETKEINLKQTVTEPAEYNSHLVIKTESELNVEIFEQSGKKTRRLTRASLKYLEEEFEGILAGRDLPENTTRRGQASLELIKSFQPGIYDTRIWVNPGEAGLIYLKAFEVTKGTPLSAGRLKTRSNEWIGWSKTPAELFFSNTHITLNEGDWGKPYAARFELWFVPDSGKTERKLLDRVFKVEGWQR